VINGKVKFKKISTKMKKGENQTYMVWISPLKKEKKALKSG
jgi:hypothetical protein